MALRTVRLDDEEELVLKEIRETGLPISEALKRGLHSLHKDLRKQTPPRSAYEIYRELTLGSGNSAIARSTDTSRAVKQIIRKNHDSGR